MRDGKRKSGVLGWFRRDKTSTSAPVLASAASTAAISVGSATVSGSDNSAASLKNLQNASNQLDQYLQSIDGEGNVIEGSRWVQKAQACSNHSFALCSLLEVPLEPREQQLARLAALSSVKVYAKPGTEDLHSNDFDIIGDHLKIEANVTGGSTKATTVSLYTPKYQAAGSSNIIVVAIRGTAIIHDWMVNLNDGAERPIHDEFLGNDEVGGLYSAHSGFLACAKGMNADILALVYQTWMNDFAAGFRSKPQLLFTGHSAGGAIAAILYSHFLRCAQILEDSSINAVLKNAFSSVHCITFGAPPITTKPLLPFQTDSIFLAIVNDEDPVPRADNKYINSLLRLFAGPMPKSGTIWALPPRLLHNAGKVLIALPSGLILRPNDSGSGSLADTVMGDKSCHKMIEYRRRLES